MQPTMSFRKTRVGSRCRLLPPGWRVKDEVDACRSAALAFVWCARASWGKRDLARWLVGPYARAIEATREPTTAHRPSSQRSVSEETVSDLLARSHAHVIAVLRKVPSWTADERFTRAMVAGGIVVGVMDDDTAIGYGPAATADMRLADRVTSLFVADFLTRPDDYARFRICDDCESVMFDESSRHAETCLRRPTESGVHFAASVSSAPPAPTPRRRITLVGLGERAA
jgi:hypothetical protein